MEVVDASRDGQAFGGVGGRRRQAEANPRCKPTQRVVCVDAAGSRLPADGADGSNDGPVRAAAESL
ncbi:hypothetical protein [Lysobacter arvi]|uniref:Uncharacterized protein n=1 Tax=Lysobacter arvi TaxID=3038776 RepID=A0ABU1CG06_9GAMM|nr:hypothetical protein [Lysobacter arvi]MDR0183882.1 hypothetical protein [Lysobacter arvi]